MQLHAHPHTSVPTGTCMLFLLLLLLLMLLLMQINDITDEELTMIMQHVEQSHRLNSCCLVNSRFKAAAIAASSAVELRTCSKQKHFRFIRWLMGQHGAGVTSVHFEPTRRNASDPWLGVASDLPCPGGCASWCCPTCALSL